MKHANTYRDGVALIILGGTSAKKWEALREKVKPNVILGANGVNALVPNLDYWMVAENMNFSNNLAIAGDARAIEFMNMFHREAGAKTKLISHWSWDLLKDKKNCINIRRKGYEQGQIPASFSLRDYGEGFMNGWVFNPGNMVSVPLRPGTVGAQLLHLAGILGCKEVHTVGFDLLLENENNHHAYPYPIYKPDRFRKPDMFVTYKGVRTQQIWIETARFLKTMEPYFERDGLAWIDHSDGLLKIEGLRCAQ